MNLKTYKISKFPFVMLSDDLNEKERNDPRVKAKFKQPTHNNISIIIFSQEY